MLCHHLGTHDRVPAARSSHNITDLNTTEDLALWHLAVPFSAKSSLPAESHTDNNTPVAVEPFLRVTSTAKSHSGFGRVNWAARLYSCCGIKPCFKHHLSSTGIERKRCRVATPDYWLQVHDVVGDAFPPPLPPALEWWPKLSFSPWAHAAMCSLTSPCQHTQPPHKHYTALHVAHTPFTSNPFKRPVLQSLISTSCFI